MTDRELIVYGAFGVWIVANLIVYWWVGDDHEFYDPKNPDAEIPWWKEYFYAATGTIIGEVRMYLKERHGKRNN